MNHKVSQLGLHLLDVSSEFIDFFNLPQDIIHLIRKLLSLRSSCIPSSKVIVGNFWSLWRGRSHNRLAFTHVVNCLENLFDFDQENSVVKLVLFKSFGILLQTFNMFLMGVLKKLQIVNMFLLFEIHFVLPLVNLLDLLF